MTTDTHYKTNSGAAMIILVLFFVFISLVLLVGIVTPVIRESQITSADLESKQAYYTGESAAFDALYRIKTGKQLGSSETLTIDSSTATATVTSPSDTEQDISAVGSDTSRTRTIDLTATSGSPSVWSISSWQESQ